jgi:class 3 adenylate cyclase/pimeloyl-ACP methyl ester carboxylesterase
VVTSDVRYARSRDGLDIAYQVVGDGPIDLVAVPGFITHLDLSWELPHIAWLEHLDGIARVILFDKRGTGLSDRSLGFGSLEDRTTDIGAVMDAAGSQEAVLMGVSEGGPMSIVFAATEPERVRGLVLYGTAAKFGQADDYPIGIPARLVDTFPDFVRDKWGTGRVFSQFIQNAPDEDAARRLIARFERNASTPAMAAEIMRRNLEIDVRPLLSSVTVPTLVIHAHGDPIAPVATGRYIADHIEGARFLELPGDHHGSWLPSEVATWRDAVQDFLATAGAPAGPVDRVLSTVLFTDIVSSTEQAERLGDRAWRALLDQHDRAAESAIARFGGRLVKTTGDGVLATFDGPSRGVTCARELMAALRPHDLHIRAGVHTGEVEQRGADVTGLGVVIASRICNLAGADQVLVSRTVKDLMAGSGIPLVDAGTHRLKGVPDEWPLYALGAG